MLFKWRAHERGGDEWDPERTYLTREEGLAAAQTQLRHKSPKTTMKYDRGPVEDCRDALDRVGYQGFT